MDCTQMGNLIKEQRLCVNLTQKQLGELVNVSDKAVSKWERGICFPDISLIEKLAEALEIPVNTLISKEEKKYLKEQKRNKKLIFACICYFLLGITLSTLYMLRPVGFYIMRVHLLIIICIYLLLFISTILLIWRKEMYENNF